MIDRTNSEGKASKRSYEILKKQNLVDLKSRAIRVLSCTFPTCGLCQTGRFETDIAIMLYLPIYGWYRYLKCNHCLQEKVKIKKQLKMSSRTFI